MEKKSSLDDLEDEDRDRSYSISDAKIIEADAPRRKYSSITNDSYDVEEALSRGMSISEAKTPELNFAESKSGAPPLQSMTGGGYNQTYLIMKSTKATDMREVFFKCGQWCYKGDLELFNLTIGTADLPAIIPALQRQQGRMKYFCPSKNIPAESDYHAPMEFIEEANSFIATEIVSDKVEKELKRWSNVFRWIQEDTAKTYFELLVDPPAAVTESIELIATKTYNFGLILISIFHQNSIFFVLQDGEGDQPLLDVSFPNVSRHGQGLLVANYADSFLRWKKITLWHNLDIKRVAPTETADAKLDVTPSPAKKSTVSIASKEYTQTYCIKRAPDNAHHSGNTLASTHEVLFRFGNWCYGGNVQLVPTVTLADVPFVIPALRMQQAKLRFLFDTSNIPDDNEFVEALQYIQNIQPFLEDQIIQSETTLLALIDKLSSMGVGDSVSKWLQGDANNSFFEFKVSPEDKLHRALKDMELVAAKTYSAGIVTISVIFQHTVYVCIQETGDDNPLLDSKFPDISGKGRGYQIQSYDNGIEGWRTLRKVSVWQTVGALEEEFRERTTQLLQSQAKIDSMGTPSSASIAEAAADLKASSAAVAEEKTEPQETAVAVADAKETRGDEPAVEDSKAVQSSFISAISASEVARGSLSPMSVSRPHHLPKLDTLSKKVEELRRNLDEEGQLAPWDGQGKPLVNKSKSRK